MDKTDAIDAWEELQQWNSILDRWGIVEEKIDDIISSKVRLLCDISSTQSLEKIRQTQGEIGALRQIRALPKSQVIELTKTVDAKGD